VLFVDTSVVPNNWHVYQNGAIDDAPSSVGTLVVDTNATFSVASNQLFAVGALSVSTGVTFTVGGGATIMVDHAFFVAGNATVVCQSVDNAATNALGLWSGRGATLIASNLTVEAGARISADNQGYVSQTAEYNNGIGPGAGQGGNIHAGAGGSHGGRGGDGDYDYYHSAPAYGSMLAPLTLGSSGGTHWGGASGVGGGAIRIVVADTAALDGWITANGSSAVGHSGGGAGGSIWLTAGALSGQGGFRADGGAYAPGYAGGGVGGGRRRRRSPLCRALGARHGPCASERGR